MPRALDLYCGAGSVAVGLMQAGYDVDGVDIEEQPDYPGAFYRMDALHLTHDDLSGYDLVWASPPCHPHSMLRGFGRIRRSEDLIPQTRELLALHPYTVIENVPWAPLRKDLILSWQMFDPDPPMIRKRIFEMSFTVLAPPAHRRTSPTLIEAYGHGVTNRYISDLREARGLPRTTTVEELEVAFGRRLTGTKTERRERLNAMVPSVYSRHIAVGALRAMAMT